MQTNDMAGISFKQPTTFDERFGIAEQCNTRLDMKTPVLLDDMKNTTCENYAAFPDRLYIIDRDGKVTYKGGRGPFGYKPRELEQSLLLVMMDAQIKARAIAGKERLLAEEKAKKAASPPNNPGKKPEDRQKKTNPSTRKTPRPEPPGPDPTAPQKSQPCNLSKS